MKRPRARVIAPDSSHEEVFAQRYHWLMGWALRLTNNDREQAEDLVQDTFVHFMISRPDLGSVQENVEGYLYSSLRNMHVSQVRRALRVRETAFPIADILSISETTSVQGELRSTAHRVQIQDELCRICQYASIRKNSSKVGSVVILRFFQGYYPNEIAAVTGSTRAGVDKMLQRARTEARLYLKHPDSLSFLHGEQQAPDLQIRFGQQPEDLLTELRQALYSTRIGACLSIGQLREAYQSQETDGVNHQMLAHVVCCAVCLDQVNRLLGLPLLAEREPEGMTGRDKRDRNKGDGGSGDGSSTGDFMDKPRRRLKQVLEHRPKELRVSVNGFILGSHTINSESNQLSISAKGEERIGFVEVFSEEEVRLLFCVVEPPPEGPVERKVVASLSDERNLELSLDFSDAWPNINVTYHDPAFCTEAEVAGQPIQSKADAESIDQESGFQNLAAARVTPLARCREWIASRLPTFSWNSLLRPGTVIAAFALLLIAVLVFVQLRRIPPAATTAADLLDRSVTAETALASRTDQVLHRTISLEAKNLAGEIVARQRIEVWHSGEKKITARRLYDDRGVLIAGDWRRADGVQTLYHHGAKPQLQLAPEKRHDALIANESVWQLDPSAKDFSSLIAGNENAHVEETATAYVISYAQQQAELSRSRPVKATLTLSKSDLHATELTVVIQAKGGSSSTTDVQRSLPVEFRFVESRFERRPNDAVAPALFEPDPDLVSSAPPLRNSKPETPLAVTQPLSPVIATAALEVEVLNLLHQVGADLGEQISVTRVTDGQLKIQGLVDTDKRKAELLAALNSVSKNLAVKIEINTVAEATAAAEKNAKRNPKSVPSPDLVVQRVEATKDAMPAGPELRRYFGDEEQTRRFASRMINRSHEAMRHAGALKRLLNQFSPQELRELDPEARAKWLALVRSHANAFQAEISALRQELQPIFFASASPGASPDSAAITSDEELARAVARLFDLGSANDERVRAAFSSSATGTGATINPQLWGFLKSTESLAAAIQKAR